MATSKKSAAGGRGNAPSKAAAARGGRATGSGKKAAAPKKAAVPKKAAAKKSAPAKAPAKKATASGSKAAGSARGASGKAAAARGGRGSATKATAAKKATTGGRGAAGSAAATTRGGRAGGGAQRAAATTRGGRGSAAASVGRAGVSAASRGSRGGARGGGRGAQQSSDPRNDLDKLMRDGLKDIYYAEKKLVAALGKMSKQATSNELKSALDTHRAESEQQVSMLEDAFASLGEKVKGVKCAAMDGILEEATEHMGEYGKGPARDASIIVSAQKAEHYEIASYGTLATFAKALGYSEAKDIFGKILDQEKATDEKLSTLADSLNAEALRAHNETEEDSDDRSEENNSDDSSNTSGQGDGAEGGMSDSDGTSATNA